MTMASEYAVKGPLTSLPALDQSASSETVIRSSASEVWTSIQVPCPAEEHDRADDRGDDDAEILTKPEVALVSAAASRSAGGGVAHGPLLP